MSAGTPVKMKKRLHRNVSVVAALLVLVIIANLCRISIFQYSFYDNYADSQQLRSETIKAQRGTIYDRNMEVLAQSATVWDVSISPKDIATGYTEGSAELTAKRETLSKGLAEILGGEYEDILARTEKTSSQYELVGKKVDKETADAVRSFITENGYTNEINLTENVERYYPNNELASSVIGFTGSDLQGLYGIESKYDDVLKGTDGYVVALKNALSENMPQSYEQRYDPVDGNSLRLTIDENIQSFVEKTLSDVVAQHNPAGGACAIVMDCNTGAVLAMADYPNYNLNDPFTIYDEALAQSISEIADETERKDARSAALSDQWTNKNVSYTYHPGSTFKTVVAAAALEEGKVSLSSSFYCPGYVKMSGYTMRCNQRSGHGQISFTDALVHSCNPAFINIGLSLGAESFYEYYCGFGFTEKTGIDLPGEQVGTYYTADMADISLASSSFGQSQSVTHLQLLTAVCAVTNGGYLVEPYVVEDVLDADGNVVSSHETQIRRQVVSEETSATMRSLMEEVVNADGGTNGSVKGYRIAAKSGTSQKTLGAETDTYIASYVAVAPADDPQIAVYVMVDEPTSGDIYGGVICAPAVAAIMADTLPYLGYSPNYSEEELESMETTVPLLTGRDVAGAKNKLIASGITGGAIVKGSGDSVVRQVPSSGSKIPKDGKVILYTDDSEQERVTMPNVVGLTPTAAKQQLKQYNLNVTISGSTSSSAKTKVQSQSIAEGTKVAIGTVVELTCVSETLD